MIKTKIGQQVEFLASEIDEKKVWLVGTVSKKYITRESGKPRVEIAVQTELGEWLMSPHNCRHLTPRAADKWQERPLAANAIRSAVDRNGCENGCGTQ